MCVASRHAYLCLAVRLCLVSYNTVQETQKYTIDPQTREPREHRYEAAHTGRFIHRRAVPALKYLRQCIEGFATFIAFLPGADLEQEPLAAYNFAEALSTLTDMQRTEQHIAIDRWKDILCTHCSDISKAFPDQWKKKCIETYDPIFRALQRACAIDH